MTLAEVAALEQEWAGRVTGCEDPAFFGWEPAPLPLFTALLAACLPHVPAGNATFLDAGCGIGTKALLAAQAGLEAYGLDRVPAYVAEAIRVGVIAWEGYAEDYDAYARYGLVYVNHPLRGPAAQAELERQIHAAMAPGAVLLAVNYGLAPAGWAEVARSGDWNAAWVKP